MEATWDARSNESIRASNEKDPLDEKWWIDFLFAWYDAHTLAIARTTACDPRVGAIVFRVG